MSQPKNRKSIRFKSIPICVAYVDLTDRPAFSPQLTALVANESYTGCAIVLVSDFHLQIGQIIKIKIAELDPLQARVVWFKTLEENIHKLGLTFTSEETSTEN